MSRSFKKVPANKVFRTPRTPYKALLSAKDDELMVFGIKASGIFTFANAYDDKPIAGLKLRRRG